MFSLLIYNQAYPLTPILRKDRLDKLGLDISRKYDDLKKVANTFTKGVPDGISKDDTYELAMM